MTSRPRASAASSSSVAAALLLTTTAAGAPVRCLSRPSTWLSRWPRVPASRSNSRLTKPPAESTMACTAAGASGAATKIGVDDDSCCVDHRCEWGCGQLLEMASRSSLEVRHDVLCLRWLRRRMSGNGEARPQRVGPLPQRIDRR